MRVEQERYIVVKNGETILHKQKSYDWWATPAESDLRFMKFYKSKQQAKGWLPSEKYPWLAGNEVVKVKVIIEEVENELD